MNRIMRRTLRRRMLILAAAMAGIASAFQGAEQAKAADSWWDANGTAPVNGDTGGWNTGSHWSTTAGGSGYTGWTSNNGAIFTGTAGTVTISGNTNLSVRSLQFGVDGYTIINSHPNARISLVTAGSSTAGPATIEVTTAGHTATMSIRLTGSAGLTKTGAGTLLLSGGNNGNSDFTGNIMISGGLLAFAADSNLGNTANDFVLNGGTMGTTAASYTLGGSRVITLNNVAGNAIGATGASGNITISGVNQLTGSGGFTKAGSGTLTISNRNNYTGDTIISAGTLILGATGSGSDTPLGTIAGGTTVSATGAALNLNGYTLATTEALYLNGTGVSSAGALTNSGAAATWSGAIALQSDSSIGGTGNITLSNNVTGTYTLSKVGTNVLTLNGTLASAIVNVNAGTLKTGAADVLSNGAAVNVSGGTLDVSGFADTINSLTITSGAVNLKRGNILTSSNAVDLGGTINFDATGADSGIGRYTVIDGNSISGIFTSNVTNGNVAFNSTLVQDSANGDLIYQHMADQTLTSASPATINIITGATTLVSATLTNTAPSGSTDLAVSLGDNTSTHGTLGSFTGTGPVAVGTPLTVGATFTADAVGAGVWSLKNTDANAVTTSVNAGGTVNVYNHANGALSLTSNATVNAIAGQVITPTFTFTNSGANNASLSIQGDSNFTAGATGTLTAGQSAAGLTAATITAPTAGTTTSKDYSITWLEDQTVIGATAGNQTSGPTTVTVNAYNHANGALSLTSNATVNAIAGQVITPTFTFTNSGVNSASLSIQGNNNFTAGANGTLTSGQSASGLTAATITAPTAGTNTSKDYSITWLEDQTVIGATAGNQTSGPTTVTVNAYSHASGALSLTSPASVNAYVGTVITPTFTFTNSGANNASLSIQGNGNFTAGATGTLTAGQSAAGLTAAGITAATGGASKDYSITWLEDQSVIGATAGNQTSGPTTVTVNGYDHPIASFASGTATDILDVYLGSHVQNSGTVDQAFNIYNYLLTAADLNLTGFTIPALQDTPIGQTSLSADLNSFAGLDAGDYQPFTATLTTATVGVFARTYVIHFTEQDFGQGTEAVGDLTLNLHGEVTAVPEPGSLSLMGLGLLVVLGRRRRKPQKPKSDPWLDHYWGRDRVKSA